MFVFATASLRNVANTDEAVAAIEAATGFEVEILTGSREAFLDFIGAAHFTRLSSGVLVDIGGGSTEIVTFTAGEADRALSIPIGSLKLYTAYVESVLPDKAERKKIRQRVMAELDGLSGFSQQTVALMVGVGGSIRAAGKLYQDETGLPFTERIPVAALQKLLGKVEKADRATLRRLLQVMPDRVHTFIPGMILLETIASYFQVKELTISPYGVREGYVYDRMSRETRKG